MIVVGLDVSLTCTGITVIADGQIWTGRARTSKAADSSAREVRRRIRVALRRILDQLPESALFVVEGPAMASKFGQPHERAGLWWMLVDQLLARGEVVVVPPKTRAKFAANNGNADKKAVVKAMRTEFPRVAIPDDNVADSLSLALMGVRHCGVPLDAVSPKRLEAMGAVSWPDMKGM